MTSETVANSTMPESPGDQDFAWAAFDCSLSPAEVLALLGDAELALRTNPLLEFSRFEAQAPGVWHVVGRNLSNDRHFDTSVTMRSTPGEIDLRYSAGLKGRTTFRVEPRADGAHVTISDHYDVVPRAERLQRLAEVDLSLNAWARGLQTLLRQWARWGWLGPWRWYMARMWKPMTPSARRITFLLLAITLFEFVTAGVALFLWYLLGT